MRIEDRRGDTMPEATVTIDDEELMDLLQGLADVVEGTREHLHFKQIGGPQLVIRREAEGDADPIGRQLDWWVGPMILVGTIFLIIGAVTFVRWAVNLVG